MIVQTKSGRWALTLNRVRVIYSDVTRRVLGPASSLLKTTDRAIASL